MNCCKLLWSFLEYLRDRRFPFVTEEKRVYFSQYKGIFPRAAVTYATYAKSVARKHHAITLLLLFALQIF